MRSEDLQKEIDKEIDQVLARSHVWDPPAHFSRTVSAQATSLVTREASAGALPRVSITWPDIARAAGVGFLVAATAYLAHLVVLAPVVDWWLSDRAVAASDAYGR